MGLVLVLLTSLSGCANESDNQKALDSTATEAAAPATGPSRETSSEQAEAVNPPEAIAGAPAAPLDERAILNDPNGQWAVTASASSTYAQTTDLKAGYSPWQATGAPNVDRYSDSPLAWTTKTGDSNTPEWLEVRYATPVHATSIRIRQTAAPGAISRIELIDTSDVTHVVWKGVDDTPYAKDTIGWFIRDVAKTSYLVKGARITLDTARVWNWNEIDAVQLVGEQPVDQVRAANSE